MGTLNAIYLGVADYVEESNIAEFVDSVQFCNFTDHMFIDVDLLYSLQILPDPSKVFSKSKSQKSCLFDLVNYTATSEGYLLLMDWVRKPLADITLIMERQSMIRYLSSGVFGHDNRGCSQIVTILRSMKGCFAKVLRLKTNEMLWQCWNSLILLLRNSVLIVKLLRQHINVEELHESSLSMSFLLNEDLFAFQELERIIHLVIAIELSAKEGKIMIRDGVDAEIDRLRSIYNNLDSILQTCTKNISECYPGIGFNTIYIPQLGFLVSREITHNVITHDTTDVCLPSDWKEVFATSTHLYYKSPEVRQLDDAYGDVHTLIIDREIEIIQLLQEKEVDKYASTLVDIMLALTELDCLCSLATVSQLPGYKFPKLTTGYDLCLKQSRHPLVETYLNLFVPNDVEFSDQEEEEEEERIMVLTGANFSGKSVFLNQIALITVLAQLGCAIPAQLGVIGVVDMLLTRILSRESLEKHLSTFAIDINQLSKCITLATDKSLILVDEFGKGSDSIDSPALFGGAISYLARMSSPPRCIMSTHYLELFRDHWLANNILSENKRVKYVSMQISLQPDLPLNTQHVDSIKYLYKVKAGVAADSFGIHCAKFCGLPQQIINRAKVFAEMLAQGKDLVDELMLLSKEEETQYAIARDVVMQFLTIEFDETEVSPDKSKADIAKFESLIM